MNFWHKLKQPVIGLSPMDGITDGAFRYIVSTTSNPSVIFSEFVNADGLIKGTEKVFDSLLYHESERPIVAQLFGSKPEFFYQAAQVVCELGFDGIDINMGCPSKTVSRHGSGAGLIKTPLLAKEIIDATKKGINTWLEKGLTELPYEVIQKTKKFEKRLGDLGVKLSRGKNLEIPLSVKTRIGYDSDITEEWISFLAVQKLSCITVHGRTLKQMYSGNANWESIRLAGQIIHANSNKNNPTFVLGNGDISSYEMGIKYIKQYSIDGVLVGRAALGNPWFFTSSNKKSSKNQDEVINKMLEQLTMYDKLFDGKYFVSQRKHIAWYIKGFPGCKDIKILLMQAKNLNDVKEILKLS